MQCSRKNSRGSALVLVLITIVVLTAMITSSMERTRVDTSLSGTWNRKTRASGIAETALAIVARQVLDYFITHETLNTTVDADTLLGTVQMGSASGGQYAVIVVDNDDVGGNDQDGDGVATTDADQTFHLVATSNLGTVEQVIEAYYRVETSGTTATPPDSSGIGALGLCADNVDIGPRASNVTGVDYDPPPYPCSGASCRSSPSGEPAATGLSYNTGTTVTLSGGTPSGSPSVNSNAGIDCAAWTTFLSSAADVATSTYAASSGPFNASAEAANFGTPTDPKIVLINGSGGETAQFNGNLSGNGILIIRDAHVVFNGTFTFTGLILIEDDGGGITISGNSNLFGSVMVIDAAASDTQTEITLQSTQGKIKYSVEGLGRAADAFSTAGSSGDASLSLLAWRTTAN